MKKYIAIIAIFLTAVIITCGPKGKQTDKKTTHTVAVVQVNLNTVIRTVELFGSVFGDLQVTVYPKIMGRVTQIVKPEGSNVNQGDTILFILNDIPGMDYRPGPVLSPIAGVIGKIYVDIGQSAVQSMPVASVAEYSNNIKVKAPISDQDLAYVKKGARALVSVAAIANGTFEGKVTNVSSVIDPMSGSALVEITVPNLSKTLIPGMAADVRLVMEEKNNVTALPLVALFTDGFSKVLVVDNNNIARFREIKTGLIGNELVEIKSGINVGEKVITTGKERVGDGDAVTITGEK